MITVNSCLCFKLETGGLIIGWLTFICSILASISCVIFLILLCIVDCSALIEFIKSSNNEDGSSHHQDLDLDNAEDGCKIIKGVAIGLLVILTVFFIVFGYLGWRCIQGTKARDHIRIKPLMIAMAVVTVLSILEIFSFNNHAIVNGIVNAVVDAYFFIVLYSLYNLFRQEFENRGNRHQLLQVGKV